MQRDGNQDIFQRLMMEDSSLSSSSSNESFSSGEQKLYQLLVEDGSISNTPVDIISPASSQPSNVNENYDLSPLLEGDLSWLNNGNLWPFDGVPSSPPIMELVAVAGPSSLGDFSAPQTSRESYESAASEESLALPFSCLSPSTPMLGQSTPAMTEDSRNYPGTIPHYIAPTSSAQGSYLSLLGYPNLSSFDAAASSVNSVSYPYSGAASSASFMFYPFPGYQYSNASPLAQNQQLFFFPYETITDAQPHRQPALLHAPRTMQPEQQPSSNGDLLHPQKQEKKRKERGKQEDFNFIEIVRKRRKVDSSQATSDAFQTINTRLGEKKRTQANRCKVFAERIKYQLTTGQKKAIQDIEADWVSSESIDRVIIAPVGAGKTEVAMHAALKALEKGKQVVILSPRCALAQQHFNNFQARFKDIANVVYVPSSYTKSERNFVYSRIKKGKYDIIIGTHSLLTNEIKYKDLGLAIIDEEQNFGVKQKEFLCEKHPDAHTLILTATPIPRTQELIKTGYYKVTKIDTLPEGRLSIEVKIAPLTNMELASSYIRNEKKRNGQMFFVTSQIKSLSSLEEFLKDNHPDLTFKVLHGKMKKEEQSSILEAFRNNKFNLLLSTNIIGVGIDIPNANTVIIHNANKFGMADLYQMKGRVGRGSIQAYACLLYKETITEQALAKLQAIEKFSGLNDCAIISEIDRQIRGGGNVLSIQQHGHFGNKSLEILEKYLQSDSLSH